MAKPRGSHHIRQASGRRPTTCHSDSRLCARRELAGRPFPCLASGTEKTVHPHRRLRALRLWLGAHPTQQLLQSCAGQHQGNATEKPPSHRGCHPHAPCCTPEETCHVHTHPRHLCRATGCVPSRSSVSPELCHLHPGSRFHGGTSTGHGAPRVPSVPSTSQASQRRQSRSRRWLGAERVVPPGRRGAVAKVGGMQE